MKICNICKKEIKIGESWKGDGAGYVHLFCAIGKKIAPGTMKKARKPGGE